MLLILSLLRHSVLKFDLLHFRIVALLDFVVVFRLDEFFVSDQKIRFLGHGVGRLLHVREDVASHTSNKKSTHGMTLCSGTEVRM